MIAEISPLTDFGICKRYLIEHTFPSLTTYTYSIIQQEVNCKANTLMGKFIL